MKEFFTLLKLEENIHSYSNERQKSSAVNSGQK